MNEQISFCTSDEHNKLTEYCTYIILTKKGLRARIKIILKTLKTLPKIFKGDTLVLRFPCEMRAEKLTEKDFHTRTAKLYVIIARNEDKETDLNQ